MKKITILLLSIFLCGTVYAETSSNSLVYSIARGGKLYDKWFKTNSAHRPAVANPSYPANAKYKGKKAADWRCKECHGWDYLGKDGAYGKGKHFTGIGGVQNATKLDSRQVGEILQDRNHGYSKDMLSWQDVTDLSNFLRLGTFDMSRYIDANSKKANGSSSAGKNYYQTVCVGCHDLDGKGEDTPPLGKLSNENPWETLHKIINGQPDAEMPSMRAFDNQLAADILAYIQTLPKE